LCLIEGRGSVVVVGYIIAVYHFIYNWL
jgi:hypothetical protein